MSDVYLSNIRSKMQETDTAECLCGMRKKAIVLTITTLLLLLMLAIGSGIGWSTGGFLDTCQTRLTSCLQSPCMVRPLYVMGQGTRGSGSGEGGEMEQAVPPSVCE